MIELRVPGYVYYECLDPQATEVPAEMGWPAATRHKMGRGCQWRYDLSPEQAAELIAHVIEMGEAWSYGVDNPGVGQRMVRWAAQIKMREVAS